MSGTTIRVLVDGLQELVHQRTLASRTAGRGGIAIGLPPPPPPRPCDDSNGLHLDNFRISPPLADSKGSNPGTYANVADPGRGRCDRRRRQHRRAARRRQRLRVGGARQISDDFSIEFWFKSTQGIGTGPMVAAAPVWSTPTWRGTTNDFGVSLRSDGRIVAGTGNPERLDRVDDGRLQQRRLAPRRVHPDRGTGALALYVDGAAAGTATGGTQALTAPATITFGRIQSGTNYLAGHARRGRDLQHRAQRRHRERPLRDGDDSLVPSRPFRWCPPRAGRPAPRSAE